MLTREDRRDLGFLGLLLAVYGLACAPVLHAVFGHGGADAWPTAARGWLSHHRTESREPPPPTLPAAHDESRPHSHEPAGEHGPDKREHGGAPTGHTHGAGSVEHLQAVALPSPALPKLLVAWFLSDTRVLGQERPRQGRPLRPTAMPQAP